MKSYIKRKTDPKLHLRNTANVIRWNGQQIVKSSTERVILFGSQANPEVMERAKRIQHAGREVEFKDLSIQTI